ncbi:HEPN domain-containing protein [Methanoregula formicica]|uniref:HEPN domain-containing protein n=1 Tax=Methanoregula formicica TaxID=882104 RepID=UPI0018F1AFB6|nr:HEPN domain-containing protein [Methanoregula formicica]
MPDRDLELAAETLDAADYLLKGGYYNDAVSRAYYAMFYAARALLASRDLHPKGHKGLILQFGLEFVKRGFIEESYGRALSHAKERRETVDYNIDAAMSPDEAWIIVSDARDFLDRIDRAFDEMGFEN